MKTAAFARPYANVPRLAVFVAPADGVSVLREVFRSLRGEFPGAIVIRLQAGTGDERSVADNLNTAAGFMILPAAEGVAIRGGHGYVAPFEADLAIGANGRFVAADPSSSEPMVASMAALQGPDAIAVALTMLQPRDVEAFELVRKAGGRTIALDESDRLWADASGLRVAPSPGDELLTTAAIGPRLLALASPTLSV